MITKLPIRLPIDFLDLCEMLAEQTPSENYLSIDCKYWRDSEGTAEIRFSVYPGCDLQSLVTTSIAHAYLHCLNEWKLLPQEKINVLELTIDGVVVKGDREAVEGFLARRELVDLDKRKHDDAEIDSEV